MSDSLYGVKPTGYVRKPLSVILGELEAANVTEFGPGVIQTPQSPLGQLNGLMADLIAELYEIAEDVYQSFDIDQAESARLDALAKLRLMRRGYAEGDGDFRRAITNQGEARIDIQDIVRAVRSVSGVTYAQVFINEGVDVTPDFPVPPGFVCVSVLGGSDSEVAATIRQYIVPGISTYGNTPITTVEDGYCRSLMLLRPILVWPSLQITVKARKDNYGCPPPSVTAVRDDLVAALNATLINGDDINHFRVRSVVESLYPNVEVISVSGTRPGEEENSTIAISFIELAVLTTDNVVVNAI